MLDEIRLAADRELVVLNEATIKLNRNTKIQSVICTVVFVVCLYFDYSLTPAWLGLLGIWLSHEMISISHQRHYEFKLTSYMLSQLKMELIETREKK